MPVWHSLKEEQRPRSLARLARLIANVIVYKLREHGDSELSKITADRLRRCTVVYVRQSQYPPVSVALTAAKQARAIIEAHRAA